MTLRRLPAAWSVEDNGAYFKSRRRAGQALAYAYYEEEPARRNGGLTCVLPP